MTDAARGTDVRVIDADGGVVMVEINRPPHNYFDLQLITALADAIDASAADGSTRAVVLCSAGKNFCAGMDFSSSSGSSAAKVYVQARRLIATDLPIVAAVHGAAVGGGLGLALVADFRVASTASRFAANFVVIGLHPGFGLTVTLPAVVGRRAAADLLMTGRRIDGAAAAEIGLCDRLTPPGQERQGALDLARQLAAGAPLAVRAVKRTLRAGAADDFARATEIEFAAQSPLFETQDFAEGVLAAQQRRTPSFRGL